MGSVVGRNTVLGWKLTAALPATIVRLHQTSFTMDPATSSIESEILNGNRYSADSLLVESYVEGSLDVELTHTLLNTLINTLITPNSQTAPTDTFDLYQTLDALYQRKFNACGIDSFTLNIAKKAYLKATVGIVGTSMTITATAPVAIPALAADPLLNAFGVTAVTFGATDVMADVISAKLTINNAIDKDNYAINSKALRGIVYQGSSADFAMEMELTLANYKTLADLLVADTVIANTAITFSAHTLTIYKMKLKDVKIPVSGKDKVTVSLTADVQWSTADSKIISYV